MYASQSISELLCSFSTQMNLTMRLPQRTQQLSIDDEVAAIIFLFCLCFKTTCNHE